MVTLKKWTANELIALDKAGQLNPEKRYELLNGEIYEMPPIGEHHANEVDILVTQLVLMLQHRARVRSQNPLYLDGSTLPQPDIILLKPDVDYAAHHPSPEHVYLLIEVSDSTLMFDRNQKLRQYASVKIPEVWIVNLQDHYTEVYRDPLGAEYLTRFVVKPGQSIAPLAFPQDDILPLA
jgi:Uma2 family endonuclease